MRLVFGQDRAVAEWVARRIPQMEGVDLKDFTAIGVADETAPVAGVVYSEFIPKYGTMQISVAASTPRWAQRGIIYALLSYPFDQIGVNKLWAAVPASNERSLRFNKGIGFKQEAILARHFGKDNAIVTRMFRKDFERIYGSVRQAA